MAELAPAPSSVGVYCGSSNAADPAFLAAARRFGLLLAGEGVRLVYGGGGIGLMGACARAAHEAGGRVLGVMPEFLRLREILYDDVETVVVETMHQRKQIMFEQSDGFAVFPGGIGTLEEVVELMSWRRLGLHKKPIVFYSPDGFWEPLFDLLRHTVAQNLTPAVFLESFRAVDTVEAILPVMASMIDPSAPQAPVPELM
jgi:uncharacterized protein (TIGR00730 family)